MTPSRVWIASLALACLAPAQDPQPLKEAGRIRALLTAQQEAWNRGDLTAFMQAYENSEQIRFVGRAGVTRGYAATEARYRNTYATCEAMGDLTFSDWEFTPLGKGHYLVVGKFALKRSAQGGGDASGWYTLILKRTRLGWKIIHDHTS
jgi:ketosteroid isomerase-like protein